jgi:hypothetical protein
MSKEQTLLKSLSGFYSDTGNLSILKSIIHKTDNVSLRSIEWFVTNHSKKNKVSYTTKNGKKFIVHMAYKSSLDGYSKKLFDPFCRTNRIEFNDITTTVAQLNFIKWCIEHDIIEYIKSNITKMKGSPLNP